MPAAWGVGLPQAFLEIAAPGYLTDTEWDAVGEDWLEQALAYTAKPCKGVSGPLTRIRPRRTRSCAPRPGAGDSDEQLADIPAEPLYRLADYLDQYGRHHRRGQFPPPGFWAAAERRAFPADQAALGDAAHARGLYRDAAQLHKNAAARGNLHAAFYLSDPPPCLGADIRPVLWAAAHVSLDDPRDVADLLARLRAAGADEQAAALEGRLPGAGMFALFPKQEDRQDWFRFGRKADGSPAVPWMGRSGLTWPGLVARDPGRCPLGDPSPDTARPTSPAPVTRVTSANAVSIDPSGDRLSCRGLSVRSADHPLRRDLDRVRAVLHRRGASSWEWAPALWTVAIRSWLIYRGPGGARLHKRPPARRWA